MRSIRLGWFVGVLTISSGLPIAAHAGGDANAGKDKSVACAACHISGNPASETPHLAGQRPTYIAKQLKAFKAEDRKNPLMNAVSKQLSDADVDDIAAYWASQAAGSDTTEPETNAAIKKSHVAFPKDFPKGYTQYLSSNNEEQKVVSKTYVNAVGLAATKAGKQLPDGSIIVVANYMAKLGADGKPVADKDGSWATDKVKSYTAMEARAGWGKDIPELIRNANWNYSVFTADKAPRAEVNQAVCLACHKPKAGESFLFSWKELKDKAGAK
ncbi:MAG TPA: cytochrome P460 family protein [Kofleriaceae bacterium]|jgi:cytochrome c553